MTSCDLDYWYQQVKQHPQDQVPGTAPTGGKIRQYPQDHASGNAAPTYVPDGSGGRIQGHRQDQAPGNATPTYVPDNSGGRIREHQQNRESGTGAPSYVFPAYVSGSSRGRPWEFSQDGVQRSDASPFAPHGSEGRSREQHSTEARRSQPDQHAHQKQAFSSQSTSPGDHRPLADLGNQRPDLYNSNQGDTCDPRPAMDNTPTNMHGGHQVSTSSHIRNEVDSWIDDLDASKCNTNLSWTQGGVNPNAMMTWMVQQYLPKVELPTFDGSPGDWVDFIIKFRDLVHLQEYLNDGQRIRLLLQQLKGEARRSVKGFANNAKGYVLALKKIKYLFGQRPMVAQAVLSKVTKGKSIQDGDVRGLSDLLYSINDCLITMTQLNYEHDLHSSDTLRQAVQRLPQWLLRKWSERSLFIRRTKEPNLKHLHSWLQDRVLALKELQQAQRPGQSQNPKKKDDESKHVNLTSAANNSPH